MPAFDAIVIGAGIVGTACAWRLAADNRRVLVLDSREPGTLATAAGMGHIVLMDDAPARFALTRYGRELWAKLGPALPADAAFRTPGTLWLATDEGQMQAILASAVRLSERDVACEVLDPAGVRRVEPRLRDGLIGGLLVPEDSIVHAPSAARWMLAQARAAGAIFEQRAVLQLRAGEVELDSGERAQAPVIILASGIASSDILPGLCVRPRKGHLALTGPSEGFCRHEIIEMAYLAGAHGHGCESVALNVQPRAGGRALVGASRQYGVSGGQVDERIVRMLMHRAASFLPGIERAPIERAWTGFRAATPDALPLIGRHGALPGLFVATGHEGLGITTAIATGQLIADMVAQREPEIDAHPFRPDRPMRWPD